MTSLVLDTGEVDLDLTLAPLAMLPPRPDAPAGSGTPGARDPDPDAGLGC